MSRGRKPLDRAMYGCGGDPIDDDRADDLDDPEQQEWVISGEPETVTVPLAPLVELLLELHDNEYLTEQQCARLLGWDLLDWRIATMPAPHPFGQEP